MIDMIIQKLEARTACAYEIKSDFITLSVGEAKKIIEHLKQPKPPKEYPPTRYMKEVFGCGSCKHEIEKGWKVCPYCETPVEWSEGNE